MVPPEGIDKIQPTTLPADFGEWDSGEAPAPEPAEVNAFDRFPGSVAAPKPPAKPVTARVAVLPAADRMPQSHPLPPRKPARRYPEPEPVYQMPQSQDEDLDDLQQMEEDKAKKKKMLIAVGVAALVLIVGSVGYLKLSSKPAANQPVASVATAPGTTGATPTTEMALPEPAKPAAAAAANSPQAVTPTSEAPETPSGLGSKQSEAMNRSLNAPSRIKNDVGVLGGSAPTGGFSPSGMDMGSGNAVFASGNGPKVKVAAPQKVSISAGIAVGLLVQKTAPIYPPIARSARVSGTVVIQATISKNGTIENSRAISGPAMLRQAALDAVKTWRFRPYLLDGQPVEVDTTVNVVFNLGS
jgi:periplasmic protein TonB